LPIPAPALTDRFRSGEIVAQRIRESNSETGRSRLSRRSRMRDTGQVEVATGQRELTGEKAQRIVDAMRASVAVRGIAASTFEHVASEAGVSRGLLHYYFGTKERLLVEVVRRDSEIRVARLDEPLARARTVDDVLEVLVSSLQDLIENEPGFFVLLFELFTAGRRNPEVQREVGELFNRTREHVAEILRAKEREGVLSPRFDAEAIVAYLFGIADGIALQVLSDPDRDFQPALEAGAAAARYLLMRE
jgi:AcrR family transcriptional regulator